MPNKLVSPTTSFSLFEKNREQIIVLAAICFCSFFINLGARDVDLMEARNFVTAREIIENGTWLIPTMNGEIRITKPPLPTWITALVRMTGGKVDSNLTMRIPAAIVASVMVFSLLGFMRTLTKDRLLPFISAVVLATSLLVIDMGRRNTWDIYCHSFMLMAMWIFSYGWNHKGSSFGMSIMAGFCMALSFMSKGPVSFYSLLLPCIIAYICNFGLRRMSEKWKEILLALLVFIVFSSAWPVLIHLIYPELSEAIAKTEVTSWSTKHVRPFYFYAHFVLYTGIWAIFVLAGFLKPFAKKRVNKFGHYYFVLLWVALSLLLLSIIPEKKERYLLPAIIPMAIMAGYLFRSIFHSYHNGKPTQGDRRLAITHTLVAGVAALSIPGLIYLYGVKNNQLTLTNGIVWSIVFLLMAGLIIYSGKAKKIGWLFVHTVVLVCLINISLLPTIYLSPLYRKNPAYQSLRNVRHIQEIAGLDYYYIGPINLIQIWEIGKVVKKLPYINNAFPYEKLPIALFTDADPLHIMNPRQLDSVEIQTLEKYRYHPRNTKLIKYVSLVNTAKKNSKE